MRSCYLILESPRLALWLQQRIHELFDLPPIGGFAVASGGARQQFYASSHVVFHCYNTDFVEISAELFHGIGNRGGNSFWVLALSLLVS
jgi:hypothetical protein